jgi:hypothetical protein
MYYQSHKEKYANLENEDEFLQALAEGGFQVGELAKLYYAVPPENDIKELNYDAVGNIITSDRMSKFLEFTYDPITLSNCYEINFTKKHSI